MAGSLDRCPGCRAALSSPVCPRCGADLAQVLLAHREARALYLEGMAAILRNDPLRALPLLRQAEALDRTLPGLLELLSLARLPRRPPVVLRRGQPGKEGRPVWYRKG